MGMNDNIKEKIANVSRQLFNTYGYPKVTMRQIADACEISVGNLTYHYPRKEDLLMLEHDWLMNAFLAKVREEDSALTGLQGYFTVECAFMHTIIFTPEIARLYSQVINVPSLRNRYCHAHYELFKSFVSDIANDSAEWTATVAMSGLEYELADEGILTESFETALEGIFKARMVFADKNAEDYSEDICTGISEGISLALRLSDLF